MKRTDRGWTVELRPKFLLTELQIQQLLTSFLFIDNLVLIILLEPGWLERGAASKKLFFYHAFGRREVWDVSRVSSEKIPKCFSFYFRI